MEPGTSWGNPGEQQSHAGDVAVVLAGLVGAAENHVVDGAPVDAGIALHQRLEGQGRQVVGADGWRARRRNGQRAYELRRR